MGLMRIPLLIGSVFFGGLCLAAAPAVQAPSSSQFRKLYGEPTMERFAAGSGISLTAEYGSDRLACQLLIEPAQLLIEFKDQGPLMSSPAVSQILEQVVPLGTRGKEIDSNVVQIEGNKLLRTEYENVSIRRICSVRSCDSSVQTQDIATLVIFKRAICPKHIE